jgi:tetratricopeptide (TPR) repeat protein
MDSYFEKGVNLKGTLRVEGSVHFDGDFEGEIISTNHFVVGKLGKVLGNVKTYNMTNKGSIQGNLFAENKLALMDDSRLIGDITTYHLSVDEGANFEGRCKMLDMPPKTINQAKETLELSVAVARTKTPESPKVTSATSFSSNFTKKNFSIAVAILLVTGVWWLFSNDSKGDLKTLLDKGYQLLAENKYSDAESVFIKALNFSRSNPKVYAGLGDIYFSNKRYKEALAQFERAIELTKSDSEYRIKKAKTYSAMEQLDEAVDAYQQAIEVDPENGTIFYELGMLYKEQGKTDKYLESIELSAKLGFKSFKLYETLGLLYIEEKKYEQAVVEIRKAIELKEDEPSLHLTLGKLLLELNKEAEATKVFKGAVELFPENFTAQIRLADWYFVKGMLSESIENYKAAESIDPKNSAVQVRLGQLYLDKKQIEKAQMAFEKAIELNPKDADSHYQLGKLVAADKKWNRAQSLLSNAVSLKAGYAPSHYELGKVFLGKGEVNLSLKHFKKSVELATENSDYIIGMSSALIEGKKFDKALEILVPISKKQSENTDLHFMVCNAYTKKRFYTDAITYCENALKLKPEIHEYMNRLAWLYAKKQIKLAKALDLSSETVKTFPKRAGYIDTLSEVYYALGKTDKAIVKIKEALKLVPNDPYYKQQLWKYRNIKLKKPAA